MLIELPPIWIGLLNTAGCAVLQLGLAWVFTKLPPRWFEAAQTAAYRTHKSWYERRLAIRRWKDRLPDGAKWLGGFAKASLERTDLEHLLSFIRETRRGEACHWAAIGLVPVMFIWNPWWGDAVLAGYALIANLPCILVQRYNRARLLHLVRRQRRYAGKIERAKPASTVASEVS